MVAIQVQQTQTPAERLADMFSKPDPGHPGREQDKRWIAVDRYTMDHLHHHHSLDNTLLTSVDRGLPNLATPPVQAKLLALLCAFAKVEYALEVGCLGGYVAMFLAKMNPKLRLTTLEIDPKAAQVARDNFEAAGVSDQIEIIVGDAVETMAGLVRDVQNGKRPPFQFTYVDADKERNWTYTDLAIQLSEKGSSIIVDNVVIMGKIADKHAKPSKFIKGAQDCIENAGKDSRVEAVVIQTVCEKTYDGFLMAVVQ